jgi:hypothetical protein
MRTFWKVVPMLRSIHIAPERYPTLPLSVLSTEVQLQDAFHVTEGTSLRSKLLEGDDLGHFETYGRCQDPGDLGVFTSLQLFSPSSMHFLSTRDDIASPSSADLSTYPFLMSPYGKSTSHNNPRGNLKVSSDADNIHRDYDPDLTAVLERPPHLLFDSTSFIYIGKGASNSRIPPSTSDGYLAPSESFYQYTYNFPLADLHHSHIVSQPCNFTYLIPHQ